MPKKQSYKEKILWVLLSLNILIGLISIFGRVFQLAFVNNVLFQTILPGTIPIALLLLFAVWTLSLRRGLCLITLAGLTGFLFEIDGLKYGSFFGGPYVYHLSIPSIHGVPFLIILYWSFFIYTGYSISTSFLFWLGHKKPNWKTGSIVLLLVTIIADGIIVTGVDLFMDPISVKVGDWIWLRGGPYFGVPWGNFLGWFFVTITATAIFRLFEYFYPQKDLRIHKVVFLIPVLGYGALACLYAVLAIYYQFYALAIIGLLIMLPIVATNLFLFKKSKLVDYN